MLKKEIEQKAVADFSVGTGISAFFFPRHPKPRLMKTVAAK
jgi:hypothetical protein